jgi:hypothetical protein
MEAPAAWMMTGIKRTQDELSKEAVDEAKRRVRGGGSSGGSRDRDRGEAMDLLKELVKVLATLSIANARDLREITGSLFHCFLFPAEHPLVRTMVQTGKDYYEKVKDKRKDHTEGPPFLHVWVSVIRFMAEDSMKKLQEADKHELVKYWNDAVKKPREALEMEIRHCRAKPTHDKKFYKVSFAVAATGSDFERAIVQGMTSLGGVKKIGPPPAGHLEREAQRLLERMQ